MTESDLNYPEKYGRFSSRKIYAQNSRAELCSIMYETCLSMFRPGSYYKRKKISQLQEPNNNKNWCEWFIFAFYCVLNT